MTKKQMPAIDRSIRLGARAGTVDTPLEEAEGKFRAEHDPTPQQIAAFRNGYIIGQINDRIHYLESIEPTLNRGELLALLDDVESLAAKWHYVN